MIVLCLWMVLTSESHGREDNSTLTSESSTEDFDMKLLSVSLKVTFL